MRLEPVEYNPFEAVPVDHDPFGSEAAASRVRARAPVRSPGAASLGASQGDVSWSMIGKNAADKLMTLPERTLEASETMRTEGTYNPGPAMETAGLMFTTGIPMAQKGAAGIFGGKLQTGWDNAAEREADTLAALGVSMDLITKETGLRRASDGLWRNEISDDAAKFTAKAPIKERKFSVSPRSIGPRQGAYNANFWGDKLGDVLYHPALYKAYPEIADITVHPVPLASVAKGVVGGFDPVSKKMYLGSLTPDDALGTILHEMQHWVQAKEGFFPGGNMQMFTTPGADLKLWKKVADESKKALEEKLAAIGGIGIEKYDYLNAADEVVRAGPKNVANYYKPYVENMRKAGILDDALKLAEVEIGLVKIENKMFRKYEGMYGEAEARATATRKKLTPEQRRARDWMEDIGIPREQVHLDIF